jgi:hypothetical protein
VANEKERLSSDSFASSGHGKRPPPSGRIGLESQPRDSNQINCSAM